MNQVGQTPESGMLSSSASFGDWIRALRKNQDLTQEQLAERVGCSVSAIRKIESDQRRPSRQIALLLATALQLPFELQAHFLRVARGERAVDVIPYLPPNLPSDSTALSGCSTFPQPTTPLVGRGPELEQVAYLLTESSCRLLTIVGPGGIGKTRLAVEAGRLLDDHFPDGVWFVSLETVDSLSQADALLAQAFSLPKVLPQPALERVLAFLGSKQALIILDGVEHLLPLTGPISALLQRTPVKLLVTSHSRLDLQGEWTFEITGLPVPPPDQTESLLEYSSVRLFVDTARRANRSFDLHAEDAIWVNRICRLTEGMPLAIELAAAWTRMLSPQEIFVELNRSLDFLESSLGDLPARHRSLRAVFDYTWNLLPREDRQVLARLAVFATAIPREAAEHVASARLALLSRLVDRSLLRRIAPGRYQLHALLRQYALEQLRREPALYAEARIRHARYFAAWLASLEDQIQSHSAIIQIIEEAYEDIRVAFRWAVSHADYAEIQQALSPLAAYYSASALTGQGVELLSEAVELYCAGEASGCAAPPPEEQEPFAITLATLLRHLGDLQLQQSLWVAAEASYQRALELLKPFSSRAGTAEAWVGLAEVAFRCNRSQQSLAWLEQARQAGMAEGAEGVLERCQVLTRLLRSGSEIRR